MKKSIVSLVFLTIMATVAAFAFILYRNNIELKNQISRRDTLIKNTQKNDSLSCAHDEKYVQTITKYITSDCSLIVDGKKISLDNFIKIYSQKESALLEAQRRLKSIDDNIGPLQKAIAERDRLCDAAQDTLALYKRQLRTIGKTYGISTRTRHTDKYIITDYESRKIDSALVLLSIYRKRMSYDSLSRNWIVRGR